LVKGQGFVIRGEVEDVGAMFFKKLPWLLQGILSLCMGRRPHIEEAEEKDEDLRPIP
jgi:hypothetical protein